jgi:hypothetical protein
MRQLKSILFILIICLSVIACREDENNCTSSSQTPSENCIDETLIEPDALCTEQYEPVCGCNNVTYSNSCHATNAGVTSYVDGACCD